MTGLNDRLLLPLLLAGCASFLTPCRTQCHVVTIFGLKTADCNRQNVSAIPQSLDGGLQVMRFDDNHAKSLEADVFRVYPNLQEIYLARNRIEAVAARAFSGLFSLQILDLEDNQLTTVPSDSFHVIPSLRMLSLKANPIRRIESEALTGLRNLEELNFENCFLDTIASSAFHGLKRLIDVNLVNNELQSLDPDMVRSLPASLNVLRLYRNPWTCNCRLRWLRRWISASGGDVNWDFATNTPTCSAPELIKGVAWKHLTADQFACPSRIVFNATRTSATVEHGRNVTLECTAVGDPEPAVQWTREGGTRRLPRGAVISEKRGLAPSAERQVSSFVTLVRIGTEHAGDYRCVAENSAGRSEMTFKVQVEAVLGALGADTPDSGGEVVLGVLLGIGALVLVVIIVAVHRIKRRHQKKKRTYSSSSGGGNEYANNMTPLTRKRQEETNGREEENADDDDDDEEDEMERGDGDDSSNNESDKYRVRSVDTNKRSDPTLQSLLSGQKTSDLDILTNHREETVERNRSNETKDELWPRNRSKANDVQAAEDNKLDEDGQQSFDAVRKINKNQSSVFDEMLSPSTSSSEKSDKSSISSDADSCSTKQRPQAPDILKADVNGDDRYLSNSSSYQRPQLETQRPGRTVSFKVAQAELNRSEVFLGRREASSSAEALPVDDIVRRKQRCIDLGTQANAPQHRSVESNHPASSFHQNSLVHLQNRSSNYETPATPKPSLVVATNNQNLQAASAAAAKSCLRRINSFERETSSQESRQQFDRNFNNSRGTHQNPERIKFAGSYSKRPEHQKQLPTIPPSANSNPDRTRHFRGISSPQRADSVRYPRVGSSSSTTTTTTTTTTLAADDDDDGDVRFFDGLLTTQRTANVKMSGSLTSCHNIDRIPFYAYNDSTGLRPHPPTAAANALGRTALASQNSSSKLRCPPTTNRSSGGGGVAALRPFGTLPCGPRSDADRHRSRRLEERPPAVEYECSMDARINGSNHHRNHQMQQSSTVQHHHHSRPTIQQRQQQQQQQQQHVTLLSDILLPPFGRESTMTSANVKDRRRTKTNDVIRTEFVDDDDGTAL